MQTNGAIIVIEDDLDDQEVLREVLGEVASGRELHFFDDCNAAFAFLLALTERPFLILCDINLPKVNGLELKQRIDSHEALRKKAVPFVFLTTSGNQPTINAAYSSTSLQGYFKKSHTMHDIRRTLRLILEYWSAALRPT